VGESRHLGLPIFRRLAAALRRRDWFEIGFELFIVFLGVALGMEASRWASEREERADRRQMVAALDEALQDYQDSGVRIHARIVKAFQEYDRHRAAGERPAPPILRFPLLDRPPTRSWDALVATGLARTLDPKLVFELAMHFSRADSFGDRYQRYNQFTEQQVLPYMNDTARFYDSGGKLARPFASHVQRLRELLALNDQMTAEAIKMRRELRSE
jgi:hypothetical protein